MKIIDTSKYLGIPFKHRGADWCGVDCYGLLRLFYKTEFNINIPDYEYDEEWCSIGFDWIKEYYKNNWIKLHAPIQYGVVGFRLPGYEVEHHLGIILHDLNMFLHSPLNKQVCVSKLSNKFWIRAISSFYKIRDL